MTKPPYFLRESKLIYLAVLSANYWCYEFEARVLLFFFNFWIFFLITLVPFRILSYYWLLHWLREDVKWIIHVVLREKLML